MDSPVLIVEAPLLDDESTKNVYAFLQNLTLAFESHYYPQLVRGCRTNNTDHVIDDAQGDQPFIDDDPPF